MIAWIREKAQSSSPSSLIKGIGEDCAVMDARSLGQTVVTTDMLLEDVHFRRHWTSPYFLGRKSLAVNLSDLAAMGARPATCLLALALPATLTEDYFRSFIHGFLEEARRWNLCLGGGDLSRNPFVQVTVTALGYVQKGQPLYRSSAKEGDAVLLVGDLGLSRLGLEILSRENPERLCEIDSEGALADWAGNPFRHRCLEAYLLPVPQVEVGIWLQSNGVANAMIDVSDGLTSDLAHLARESQLAAELEVDQIPLPAEMGDKKKALTTVLDGGEDYGLLFTASEEQLQQLRSSYPAVFPSYNLIGRMRTGDPGLFLISEGQRKKYKPGGFDHFR